MNEPIRYDFTEVVIYGVHGELGKVGDLEMRGPGIGPTPEGKYVLHDDYAKLQRELEAVRYDLGKLCGHIAECGRQVGVTDTCK